MELRIRPEATGDYEAVRRIHQLAFSSETEAVLVERLRSSGLAISSLVAENAGELVGHIFFSDLPIHTSFGDVPAASLAPLAVHPHWQRRGIGASLVRAGLEACREAGRAAVIVLGAPNYYRRFGFSSALAIPIQSPWSHLGEPWMAIELVPGSLTGVTGAVTYPDPFHS